MQQEHPLQYLTHKCQLVLGSESPRRVELLKGLGLSFDVRPSGWDESSACNNEAHTLAMLKAKGKMHHLWATLSPNEMLITADTIVLLGEKVLEKPRNKQEATLFLQQLSNNWHTVLTAYTISSKEELWEEQEVTTQVHFAPISKGEIDYYTDHYSVLDKAGAYGVQDWIGLTAVDAIKGTYTNVMGLPTHEVYLVIENCEPLAEPR